MAKRFISPCAPPTPREAELLACLIEECAEVQQRATKMLRFGVHEIQPGQPMTNMQRLSAEVGDLLEVVKLATDMQLIDAEEIAIGRIAKRVQLTKFLQHS